LLYFNVDHVRSEVQKHIAAMANLRLVVCDLSNVPYVDIAGARMLRRLGEELEAKGLAFRVVEAHAMVRDVLRAEGLEERVGSINRHVGLADALRDPPPSK
jgi:anti-anti-sigma factor